MIEGPVGQVTGQPEGYGTIVAEHGASLSPGQSSGWPSPAWPCDYPILLLDEPMVDLTA